jgi:hypothetical protein
MSCVNCIWHCRYCNQILDKEIDDSCTALLQDLVRFQDRLYQKDPVKVVVTRLVFDM